MFLCEQCGRTTSAGEKQAKKTIKTRPRVYAGGGLGWEIVKEVNVCQKCFDIENNVK